MFEIKFFPGTLFKFEPREWKNTPNWLSKLLNFWFHFHYYIYANEVYRLKLPLKQKFDQNHKIISLYRIQSSDLKKNIHLLKVERWRARISVMKQNYLSIEYCRFLNKNITISFHHKFKNKIITPIIRFMTKLNHHIFINVGEISL